MSVTLPCLLSILIFLPLVAGVLILLLAEDGGGEPGKVGYVPGLALTVGVVNALLSLFLLCGASSGPAGLVVAGFEERWPWIDALGISYILRIDGLSIFLVLLVTILTPVAIAASWNIINQRTPIYYGCMLLLSGGMVGVLASMDLFLFYVFWEIMLVPAFFLVGLFGGAQRRLATTKFVIYTMAGSLLMLVGIAYVGYQYFALHGTWTFDLDKLYGLTFQPQAAGWAFLTFVLAFGIKAAMFPLHTWLPITYGQAPAPVTFMLSAVMAKLGLYGFLRIALPLFPEAARWFAPTLIGLAVAGVLYSAFIALVQEDAKQVVAYASISHMGVILLGVFSLTPQAISGSVLHMVGHALTTGALFLLIGFMAERRGSTLIKDWGGATSAIPVFASLFMGIMLASVGLPGLAGFVGEFLIFVGAFRDHATATALAAVSVILGASYMLWLFQRTMFGPQTHADMARLPDLSIREGLLCLPVVMLIVVLGVFPQPVLSRINPATEAYLGHAGVDATQRTTAVPDGTPADSAPAVDHEGASLQTPPSGHEVPAPGHAGSSPE